MIRGFRYFETILCELYQLSYTMSFNRYPKCWQVDCNKGPASDKPNFAAFVRELKQAFEPHGYLLSAAVSPSKWVIDEGTHCFASLR